MTHSTPRLHTSSANHGLQQRWTAKQMPDQHGRTVLVTGANSGLGFLTSLEMAKHGAHVILTARDLRKGRDAIARIESTRPRGSVELRQLDLADLDQVKAFGKTFVKGPAALDVLFNNAGIMMPPRTTTKQGHELQFGVNHLAHFALTGLLLPKLLASPDGRVITLTSDLHKKGWIHFDDLDGGKKYGRVEFYAQSKFANALFTIELNRRVKAAGEPLKILMAHPGYAATNLQMSGPSGLLKAFMHIGNRFLAQPAEMGVLPQLYAATETGVKSGQFYGPDGKNEKKGYPTLVDPVGTALDRQTGQALWELSERLTGVRIEIGGKH